MTIKFLGVGSGLSFTPDYTDLQTWVTYLSGVTFSADETLRIMWSGSQNELSTSAVLWNGGTPSTFSEIIEAGDASGSALGSFQNSVGTASNALRYNPAVGACISIASGVGNAISFSDPNQIIRNLQWKANYTGSGPVFNMTQSADTGKIIQECIIENSAVSTSRVSIIRIFGTVKNNVIVHSAGTGPTWGINRVSGAGAKGDLYNNTIISLVTASATTIGVYNLCAGPIFTINNAIYGWFRDYSSDVVTSASSAFNATKANTASSSLVGITANNVYNLASTDFVNVAVGTYNLRISSAGSSLVDKGFTATAVTTIDVFAHARA